VAAQRDIQPSGIPNATDLTATWRRGLIYTAMSALLAWHTLAMVVAPFDDNELTEGARKLLGPYLTILALDHGWSFFAPGVENGIRFRYEVATGAGDLRTFVPSDELRWLSPIRRPTRDRFRELLDNPELYADVVGLALCRDHADLNPLSVTLVEVRQKDFWPADSLAGKSPIDPEFLTTTAVKTIPCPAA